MEQIHEACEGGIIEHGACTACGVVIDAQLANTPVTEQEENDIPTPPQEPAPTPEQSDVTQPTE